MAKLTLQETIDAGSRIEELIQEGYIEATRLKNNFLIISCVDKTIIAYYDPDENDFDVMDADYLDDILGVFGYDFGSVASFIGLDVDHPLIQELVEILVDGENINWEDEDELSAYGTRPGKRSGSDGKSRRRARRDGEDDYSGDDSDDEED